MNIVIVEDEPLLQQRIARFTQEILGDKCEKLNQFLTLEDAEDFLAQQEIDLLLLDLNLQGQNGFDLLKNQLAQSFHTIVISAYAEKALEAFEYGVLDFVAKPFAKQRLQKALQRVTEKVTTASYGCRYLSIKKTSGIELLLVSDISHIRADGHYSQIYFKQENPNSSQSPNLHSKNIEKIQDLLPQHFERVHRSYIVDMHYVKRLIIESGSRYHAELKDDTLVPIGRSRFGIIKTKLETV